MRFLVLLLGLFVTSEAGWVMESNYKGVEIGKTSNVSIVCRYDVTSGPDASSQMSTLYRIRIARLVLKRRNTLVKVGASEKVPKLEDAVVMSKFRASDVQGSFINVTWPLATEQTPGEYVCDVLGFGPSNDPVQLETIPVTIKDTALTLPGLLKMIEETKSDFQEKEFALLKRIRDLENQLNNTQDAYRKADDEIKDSIKETAMQLRDESVEAYSLVRQEVNETITKYQEADAQLRKEIVESKDFNANELRRQSSTITHLRLGLLELKKETQALNANLVEDVSDMQKEISEEIQQLNDTYKEYCQLKISELRNETEENDARNKEEIAELMKANLTNLHKDIVDLMRVSNAVGENLQKETLQRKIQDEILDAKVEKGLRDLINFTKDEISQQSLKFDKEIEQKISNSNSLNQEKYTKLDDRITYLRNQIQEGEKKFEQKISKLRNFTEELISNRSTDCCDALQESISSVENYTTIEIGNIRDKLEENSEETRIEIKTDIERKIREVSEDLESDLSDLRNLTSSQIDKQERMEKNLQENLSRLRQLVENKYVTKITLKEHLSTVYNFTEEEINRTEEDILNLKMSTEGEFKDFDERLSKRLLELNRLINNISNGCIAETEDLRLNFTHLNTQLDKRVQYFEKYKTRRESEVDESFQNILRLIDSMDIKYENVTSSLREDLTAKSQCMCPTEQPAKPTAVDKTSLSSTITTIRLESTASEITTESPSETTATPTETTAKPTETSATPTETTDNPTETTAKPTETTAKQTETTVTLKETTAKPTETTPTPTAPLTLISTLTTTSKVPRDQEWPEGSYAIVTPESGCPDDNGFEWEQGWIQFHTSTEFNDDLVSKGNHFKMPIFLRDTFDNFVRMHYCVNKQSVSSARQWPKGSYCINRVNGQCPLGFQSRYIQYDEENTHVQYNDHNAPDISYVSEVLKRVYYCCRRDGSAYEAIKLPIDKPFYLHRVNDGSCQKVSGMTFSLEIIQIDTNHDDNEDAFEDLDIHPHATLQPVRQSMCYYSPVTDTDHLP